ncbi:MAG: undecaprenyl-diphosphate phosphatase [Actinomycetes bacterium]
MSFLESIVLGVVQGLTEFLPISSNAHMRITAALFGWSDPGAAFSAVTQIGTEIAVLLYFRKDILQIIKAFLKGLTGRAHRKGNDWRLAIFIIIGSLPIAILGIALKDPIENQFRSLKIIAVSLILFAVIIGLIDRRAKGTRELASLTLSDSIKFGLAQSLALIPGVSRSGGTIAAGLALGYSRVSAARYSFLLAIPAVLGSGGLELRKIGGADSPAWGPTFLATIIAFGVGYLVIAWLLKFLTTHTFRGFMIYRVLVGIAVLAALGTGAISG